MLRSIERLSLSSLAWLEGSVLVTSLMEATSSLEASLFEESVTTLLEATSSLEASLFEKSVTSLLEATSSLEASLNVN